MCYRLSQPILRNFVVIKNFLKFKFFYDPSELKHNPKRIYFALKVPQNWLTKSIQHKLKMFDSLKKKQKKGKLNFPHLNLNLFVLKKTKHFLKNFLVIQFSFFICNFHNNLHDRRLYGNI